MRKLLMGVAATTLFATAPALAADLPMEPAPAVVAVPSFSWTGAYVGVQAGYAWGRSKPGGFNVDGWLLGGYAGYNVQLDNSPVVIGVETDFNYADQDDDVTTVAQGNRVTAKNEVNWAGATRARVGFAFDRFLVYAAGGVAYANREIGVKVRGRVNASFSDKQTAVGWTIGGGVEAAVTENVVLRGEYRYTDYGSDKFNIAGVSVKSDLDEHRVMAGVAYKFGW